MIFKRAILAVFASSISAAVFCSTGARALDAQNDSGADTPLRSSLPTATEAAPQASGSTAKEDHSRAAIPQPSAPKSARSSKRINWASLPYKTFAFGIGAVVGTPVCICRKIVDEEKEGIKGCVGDTDKQHMRIIAGIFWLPFAASIGSLEAPVYSTINSVVHADKPFSRDQFSLGEMAAH